MTRPLRSEDSELLTSAEVAARFGVSPNTVLRWKHQGRIPSLRTPGGTFRFRANDIRQLFEHTQSPQTPKRKSVPPTAPVSRFVTRKIRAARDRRVGRKRAGRDKSLEELRQHLHAIDAALEDLQDAAHPPESARSALD